MTTDSTEAAAGPDPVVYQLRVWIRGISPMIWRRLLVRSDSTIEDLHYTLQLAFGWSDDHLNRFHIHGRDYGVYHSGGIGFDDDPREVRLADFGFRPREYFFYEYDMGAGWRHEVRVERLLAVSRRRHYPVCLGGAHAVPPESCRGPEDFLEMRARLKIQAVLGRQAFWDFDEDDDEVDRSPQPWLDPDRFDRRDVNEKLQQYARGEREWLFCEEIWIGG